VDAVLCGMQTGAQENQSSPSRSLRVRLGVVTTAVIRIGIANISCSTGLLRWRCVTSN
jgi:hypothetical protein